MDEDISDFPQYNGGTRNEIPLEAPSVVKIYTDAEKDQKIRPKPGKKLVSCVKSDFKWPSHLYSEGEVPPNFHSVSWGPRGGHVFEVMGNRSIFTVLQETSDWLEEKVPFDVFTSPGNIIFSGTLCLKNFLNGGAANNLDVFEVTDCDAETNLLDVLIKAGYTDESAWEVGQV